MFDLRSQQVVTNACNLGGHRTGSQGCQHARVLDGFLAYV
jgi:hypothetical protein